LIHADKHGFMVIPPEGEENLLEAAIFMDENESKTVIKAARSTNGLAVDDVLEQFNQADAAFSEAVQQRYGKRGEW
jgi:4-hydroxy-4-methyl-2-oxoglutarate aldolase